MARNKAEAQLTDRPTVVSTRCRPLDVILQGGFPVSRLSLVYGEASTGKTTLAMQCAIECARRNLKTLYIDADRSFSHNRLAQLSGNSLKEIGENIVVFTPETFSEQVSLVERIGSFVTDSTGLLVVDTVTSLYRSALGSQERVFAQNRELNRQMAYLAELASMKPVAMLLTSQVHAHPSRDEYQIEPVAKRILTYWSEVVLRLTSTANSAIKKAQLERYPSPNTSNTSCVFKITERGLEETITQEPSNDSD